MTDDPWINFFVVLTVGANIATLTVWILALAARFGRGVDIVGAAARRAR